MWPHPIGPWPGPLVSTLLLIALSIPVGQTCAMEAPASEAADRGTPAQIYEARCAHCHDGSVPRAPHLIKFQVLGSKAIHASLTQGSMRVHVADLDDSERQALADHLGGAAAPSTPVKRCTGAMPASAQGPVANGWGLHPHNTRFLPTRIAGLTAEEVPKLKLRWAFAYSGATRARSQPAIKDNLVYVGGQSGAVHALDLQTGCAWWTFQADAEVRSAVTWNESGERLFFGDINGWAYAIAAADGSLIWRTRVDSHPDATLTGSPRYLEGRVLVPVSSMEWASAADPGYACCTFRGGVVALNADDGSRVWHAYSIAQPPMPAGVNALGTARFHPAGAPVWNSPTLDAQRGRLYVGTGEAYTSPAVNTSDAVLAFALDDGRLVWSHQALAGDAWNMACFIGGGANCPEENGPDFDIGAPPILARTSTGRQVLIAGQKSGAVFALDPDNPAQKLWRRQLGRGGFAGGVHWGMAAGEGRLYVPIADTTFTGQEVGPPKPGLFALDPDTGRTLWYAPAPDVCAAADKPACDPGFSAAITAIPGVVFAGAFDGHLRAYGARDGALLWDFDSNQSFATVSGEIGHGGSIESDGPVLGNGHLLVNSGYLFGDRMAGNLLLAFAPAD